MGTMSNCHICPVCGYDLGFVPWDSLEICPSCYIQFGYDDSTPGGAERRQQIYAEWRQRWINDGMPWSSVGQPPPPGWNPTEQLKRID
jgi:hypothetical protein